MNLGYWMSLPYGRDIQYSAKRYRLRSHISLSKFESCIVNYFDNVALGNMKATAIKTTCDDEWFRSGILQVVSEIEHEGTFIPKQFNLLSIPDLILNAQEKEHKRQLLTTLGLTPEQGNRFAIGASNAESALRNFARK